MIFLDTILLFSFLEISIVVLLVMGTENLMIEFDSFSALSLITISILFPLNNLFGLLYFLYLFITV